MRLCGCAAVRLCGCAAVLLCGSAAVRLCGCAAVPLCRCAAVPLCRCAAVLLCCCAAASRSSPAVWECCCCACMRQAPVETHISTQSSLKRCPAPYADAPLTLLPCSTTSPWSTGAPSRPPLARLATCSRSNLPAWAGRGGAGEQTATDWACCAGAGAGGGCVQGLPAADLTQAPAAGEVHGLRSVLFCSCCGQFW